MREQHKIWRLHVCGKRFVGLVTLDSSDYAHFLGQKIEMPWSPPPCEMTGKSKRLPDFVCWMKPVPVVSERARNALLVLVRDAVQFLPFHSLRGKPYYALNVLEMRHNLLDVARSELSRFSTDGRIFDIERAVFREPLPAGLPHIFKLGEDTGDIFVTTAFAELVVEHQLTGVQLLAPTQNILRLILGREALNAYPGTPPVDA